MSAKGVLDKINALLTIDNAKEVMNNWSHVCMATRRLRSDSESWRRYCIFTS